MTHGDNDLDRNNSGSDADDKGDNNDSAQADKAHSNFTHNDDDYNDVGNGNCISGVGGSSGSVTYRGTIATAAPTTSMTVAVAAMAITATAKHMIATSITI